MHVSAFSSINAMSMQHTCGHVERSGIEQHVAPLIGVNLRQLSEAHVIANAQAELGKGRGENAEVGARSECFGLLKGNLPWHINVKQVQLPVLEQ